MTAAELAHFVLGLQLFQLVVVGVPDVEEGEKVGLRVEELPVHLIGLGLLVRRALARVLDADGRGDDQNLAQGPLPVGLEDHAGHGGRDGQASHVAAQAGQPALRIQGAQLFQQEKATPDGLGRGRVDDGKGLHLAQLQGQHVQDHLGQVGALDLGLGVDRPGEEVGLAVEAHAHPVGEPAATALALPGAALGDRLDG